MTGKRLLASLAAVAALAGAGHAQEARRIDAIAAVVNTSVITQGDLFHAAGDALSAAASDARAANASDADFERVQTRILKDALDAIITRRLVASEYKSPIPETFVDDLVNDEIRRKYVDRVNLIKELHDKGQSYASFRKDLADRELVRFMFDQKVGRQIVVSPRKMERYYAEHRDQFKVGDRVKVRMIYLDRRNHEGEDIAKLAREALARIKAGADFATVAADVADDNRTHKGGDWGWIDRDGNVVRKEIREAAFALEKGAVSDVLEIGGAVWIIKAEDKQEAHVRTLSEMRKEIEEILRREEVQRLQNAWIGRLRKAAHVQIF